MMLRIHVGYMNAVNALNSKQPRHFRLRFSGTLIDTMGMDVDDAKLSLTYCDCLQ